jgi:hypothetical protein
MAAQAATKPSPSPSPAADPTYGPPASIPSEPSETEAVLEPSLPKFNPTWRNCREDKDCIAIDTHCGWGCINGSSEQPASMYYRQLAPFIECSATGNDKPAAICVKKECVCQK